MEYADTWVAFHCECGKTGWYCAGDMSDMTAYEPDALKCWNCGKIFDEEQIKSDLGLEPDEDLEENAAVEILEKHKPGQEDLRMTIRRVEQRLRNKNGRFQDPKSLSDVWDEAITAFRVELLKELRDA